MDERVRFVARLLDGEKMAVVCRIRIPEDGYKYSSKDGLAEKQAHDNNLQVEHSVKREPGAPKWENDRSHQAAGRPSR